MLRRNSLLLSELKFYQNTRGCTRAENTGRRFEDFAVALAGNCHQFMELNFSASSVEK